ncbi:hypothetical protein IAD21_00480 [Abditibacteriota bacterium]|nr:hypothetical protein IAD21_00480 [Abditibacteriota bacterium]
MCESLKLNNETNQLQIKGLSIVNGCQSLTTILACSEKAKAAKDAHVLFRFYEIPQRDIADKISINTNSQSAVKPRDLRSNDKRVLALKRVYESMYRNGYLITKRGEERPADRDESHTIDIALLAKWLMTWHCQRPNIAYNENRIFDKYFEQIFRADYSPTDMLALKQWAAKIETRWNNNSLKFNDALLAVPSYSKFHLLFAIQTCFCAVSEQLDKVPLPAATNSALAQADTVITIAASCYNSALKMAVTEYQSEGKIFSPQNWLKAKDSVSKVQGSVDIYLGMLDELPGGTQLRQVLTIPADKFTLRWSAD